MYAVSLYTSSFRLLICLLEISREKGLVNFKEFFALSVFTMLRHTSSNPENFAELQFKRWVPIIKILCSMHLRVNCIHY